MLKILRSQGKIKKCQKFSIISQEKVKKVSVDSQLRTQLLTTQPHQSFSKGHFFARARFGGVRRLRRLSEYSSAACPVEDRHGKHGPNSTQRPSCSHWTASIKDGPTTTIVCQSFSHLMSGESKWQPLNGSRRMVRKSAKTDGHKRSETDRSKSAKTIEKVQQWSKTSENRRESAKTIGMFFGDRFFLPFSSGHIAVPI